jgi:hypothetical protein
MECDRRKHYIEGFYVKDSSWDSDLIFIYTNYLYITISLLQDHHICINKRSYPKQILRFTTSIVSNFYIPTKYKKIKIQIPRETIKKLSFLECSLISDQVWREILE